MKKTNVLFVASEAVPFIKTGGLADVAGALPKYFNREKYDIRVIMPKYTCIRDDLKQKMEYVTHFITGFNFREQYCGLLKAEIDGVIYYFIDSEYYFSGDRPYAGGLQDIERFAFFSKMVLSMIPHLNWKPDIIHCHDWQAGLVPVYLNDSFQGDLFFHHMKTIFTIHNLKFQGQWNVRQMMEKTGLSSYYFTPDKLEAYGDGNMLKGGLVFADRITTVSETYAYEIRTPFFGEGLDGLLNARRNVLSGIVNGIDTAEYDPAKKEDVPYPFTSATVLKNKVKNKLAFQKELGLREDENAFMIGIVSRMTDQKGFDLINCVMNDMTQDENIQFVVLGTGEDRYENMFRYFAYLHPDRVSANILYSEALARKIYASSDAFLMPSLFEPCGLSQLMALRYGTLPIVRETGGLKDTVKPYNEFTHEGTGFSFANYNAHEMMAIVRYAHYIYREHREDWNSMVVRAMKEDFSWASSARKYEALYDELEAQKIREETPLDL